MPDEKKIYESLKNEVVYLFASRIIYKELFEHNERRLDLLQKTVPILSVLLQKMLLDNIALTICRLLDPKRTGRHKNNTLFQLIGDNDPCFEELKNLFDQIKPIRHNRHKFIAHRDLAETLCQFSDNTHNGETYFDLNFPLSMEELDDVLGKIQCLLNHAGNANIQYMGISTPSGPDLGVRNLITVLKSGVFFQQLQDDGQADFIKFLPEWEMFKYRDA